MDDVEQIGFEIFLAQPQFEAVNAVGRIQVFFGSGNKKNPLETVLHKMMRHLARAAHGVHEDGRAIVFRRFAYEQKWDALPFEGDKKIVVYGVETVVTNNEGIDSFSQSELGEGATAVVMTFSIFVAVAGFTVPS